MFRELTVGASQAGCRDKIQNEDFVSYDTGVRANSVCYLNLGGTAQRASLQYAETLFFCFVG